jgi:hypothetical protein
MGSGWKLGTWRIHPTDHVAVLNGAPNPEVREKISEQETEDYEVFAGAYPTLPHRLLRVQSHMFGVGAILSDCTSHQESDQNRPPNMIKGFPCFSYKYVEVWFSICAWINGKQRASDLPHDGCPDGWLVLPYMRRTTVESEKSLTPTLW